jgi:N-acetylmuramoyl-L-alanine amidase
VEIGFLSNPREEALLRKSDYRQKLAEALFRGVSRYADSLSHINQLAKAGKD